MYVKCLVCARHRVTLMSNIGPGFYCEMRDEQCLDHKEAEVKRL